MTSERDMDRLIGARLREDGSCSFRVWAPFADDVVLRMHDPAPGEHAMERDDAGYHSVTLDAVSAGAAYTFVLDGERERPDPASRHQPDDVHAPSAVAPSTFAWKHDDWPRPDLRTAVIYELHVGTFTPEGTFDAAADRLDYLRDLGITMIELMPVAQFPGKRNWGYDGVYPFAAQHSYGGPEGLKRFVDAAHGAGLNVALDVVYNHLGPEGNYLAEFGPYFTDIYQTPWGAALNFDGPHSDHVRHFFIESALQWIDEFRIDALRLDAIHAVLDRSAQPFLRELTDAVHDRAAALDRDVLVIAESDLGDPRVLRPADRGGFGMDAQWLDDFHHALRTLITGEAAGYYEDYGRLDHLARAFRHGYVYSGQYSAYRKRRHGAPGPDILPRQFVVYAQNHDQVGNRMMGDRLGAVASPAQRRLAAAAVILSPFTPMLFMGEEYGEERPFPYFVSHSDPALVEAVRTGRREEFAAFAWRGEAPDPQAEATFREAVLDPAAPSRPANQPMLELHRHLLRLRLEEPTIREHDDISIDVLTTDGRPAPTDATEGVLLVRRRTGERRSILLLSRGGDARLDIPVETGSWRVALNTADARFGGERMEVPTALTAASRLTVEIDADSALLLLSEEDAA